MRGLGGLVIAAIGAAILAIFATTTPTPLPLDAPPDTFAAGRAMQDIAAISRAPRPTGSAENARVRDYLADRLRGLGMTVATASAPLSAKGAERLRTWSGSTAPPPQLTNIVGVLPGTDRTLPAIMLMAHHDSVWGSPGAADDAAGVAAILETVRAIRVGGRARRDLIVLFSDAEELGLEGAKAFFTGDPLRTRVGAIIDLETRGGGGRTSMFETSDRNGGLITLYREAVRRPVATSFSVFVYNRLPNSTDYTVAKKLGIPGYNFAFVGRPALYHSPLATAAAIDPGSVQDMGRQALDLTRALLAAPALPARAPDAVFFDAYGLFLIAYPGWVGWLLLGAAAAGYATAGWGRARGVAIARGAGATLATLLAAAVLLYLGNLLSGADGPVNYYDRLAAIPRLIWQAGVLSVAAVALVWALLLPGSRQPGHAIGAAVPLLLAATFVQAVAPTAAFPLTVPLLLGGVAAGIGRREATVGQLVAVIAAILGVGYLAGTTYALLVSVGPDAPMVAAIPLALAAVLAMPLVPRVERRPALSGAGLLIAAAVAIALWVRLDPVAASVATYSTFK